MQSYFIPNHNISIELNGKLYNGYYIMDKRAITVHYNCHSKATQKSNNNDILARITVSERILWFD